MTVSFRTRAIDTWFYLCHLATRTITGRCFLAFALTAPILGLALGTYQSAPASLTRHHWMIIWFATGATYIYLAFCIFLGALLSTIRPATIITIEPEFCSRKGFLKYKSSWRAFLALREDADYFYFLGWVRTFYIPKWAFDSRAESEAFYDTALGCWHIARGTTPPIVPKVTSAWPPAPRPANSAEPGGSAEC